jgi:hypothetical protein
MLRVALVVIHVSLAALWTGAMAYSLSVVQPKVAAFLPDEREREEFLVLLAHGNRWKVIGLVTALLVTGLAVAVTSGRTVALGYTVSLALYATAAGIFVHVSWRHWPARIFAVPEELAGFRRRLRALAIAMLTMVGTAFVVALAVSVH